MKSIKLKIISDKKDVKVFLNELKSILEAKDFDAAKDINIIKVEKTKIEYSTSFTLRTLNFGNIEVAQKLNELTIMEYSETLIDKKKENLELLFVFGKDILGRQIYIKLKIKGKIKRRVLCISFHYAEWKMDFPYA